MSRSLLLFAGFLWVACCVSAQYAKIDVEDEGVKTAAQQASEELSKTFNSKYHHRLAKIIDAKINKLEFFEPWYMITVVVGMTDCKKTEVKIEEASGCDFQDNVSTYKKCLTMIGHLEDGTQDFLKLGCTLISKKDL